MKKLFSLLFMLLVSVVTFSQTNLSQEEFNKLPIETQNQIKSVKAVSQTQENIEIAGKWVGFGKEVGTAVNESLKAVTQTAVDFSNTKLGKITILLVIYKVIGEDIIQALFGVLWLILVFTVAGFIHFNYGKNKRVLKSEKYDPEAKKVLKEYTIIQGAEEFQIASVVILVVGICFSIPMFLTIGC